MSELSNKYQEIISELENRIENKDDLISDHFKFF